MDGILGSSIATGPARDRRRGVGDYGRSLMTATVVLLDADTVAGWRRAAPSIVQLHRAIDDLRGQHPNAVVAVVADASIKWALPADEQAAFEHDIVTRAVVCAPAGTKDGTYGWLLAVVERARRDVETVVAVTDRALQGVPVVRLTQVDGHFSFDLAGATVVDVQPTHPHRRRRTGRG